MSLLSDAMNVRSNISAPPSASALLSFFAEASLAPDDMAGEAKIYEGIKIFETVYRPAF
jgi:hypothetical protein